MRGMAREYAAGDSADRGGRVFGDVGLAGWRVSGKRAPSGWEWNGSQPGQGAIDLLLPRPVLGKMEDKLACRAGNPSHQSEDSSSKGLRNYLKLGLVLKGEHIGGSVKLGETWVVVDDGKERDSAHYMGSTR